MKRRITLISLLLTAFAFIYSSAQITTQFRPDSQVQISEGTGGFFGDLDSGDRFSRDHDQIGDVNGDGIIDLIVGARSDDDGATDAGAVYILFMNDDGTVQSNQKISMTEGGFTETLNAGNFFGYGVAGIGDYDDDGIPDIAVSASSPPNNSLYIIHLNADGTVKDYVKNQNITSQGLSAIGDINNDGKIDLILGNPKSDDGGTNRGAINIIFLNANSQIETASTVTISSTQGGFGTGLNNGDEFGGREAAFLGDIDGDGGPEIAVSAFHSDGGKGAVWILSLDQNNFTVTSKIKITEGLNGFTDTLTLGENPNGSAGANFGHAMCAPGDLNGDGIPDLITGANQQNEGWAYILYLNADKTVKTFSRINNNEGGFDLTLTAQERFSRSISFIGDLRGDGSIAVNFGGGAGTTGILYLLFFKPCDFNLEPGNNFYTGGNTFFSNWTHATQTVSGDPFTFEQCATKMFESEAKYMTFKPEDGRCICKDSTAILTTSTEGSFAYSNECYNAIVALPVALNSFRATSDDCSKIKLDWSTSSERNNKHFGIERSSDGINWFEIATVKGGGTINEEIHYAYHDILVDDRFSNIYYRLKQVDFDGLTSLSGVVTVDHDCSFQNIILSPNLIDETSIIKGVKDIKNISLFNISGSQVTFGFDKNTNQIDISKLVQGMYLMRLETLNGDIHVLKLMKK